jgi:threonine dehydrogenase-like Zn-dependent dehydrogenase
LEQSTTTGLLDPQQGKMKVRLLHTTGNGIFEETIWDKPEPNDNEIEVRAVMTGVCRSDIDMMMGNFGPLPLHMQGHEGLGIVTKVGSKINDITVGNFVATRGEPAYADFYNARNTEYTWVPELHPRYIIEPVACGINIIDQAWQQIRERSDGKILIIGSGFLAWVAFNRLKLQRPNASIDVLGSSNLELWGDHLLLGTSESYDVVIDLTGKYALGLDINLNNNAVIIDGIGKAISREEAQQQLWKACTTIRPSPRNPKFHQCMKEAVWMIENHHLAIDNFWTQAYNRTTEWQQAFADGQDRPNGYSRGYIKWD